MNKNKELFDFCTDCLTKEFPVLRKWLVLHRKHTCKKSNPQSGDFLCIPSPNYWYIYIFYPQTQEEIY